MYFKTPMRALLNFILIVGIKFCLSQSNDSEDICDISTQLESLQQIVKRIPAENLRLQTEQKISQCLPTNCMDAAAGSFKSGIYTIKYQRFGDEPFGVWCDEDTDYGGWLVIQRRVSAGVDFYQDWQQYKQGFGDLSGNYWIGLEKLHALTASCEQELYIKFERFNGERYYAKYDLFAVGSEEEDYVLQTVGNYKGNAGDSLTFHKGHKFSTFDRDNDDNVFKNCAQLYRGAWWHYGCGCYQSNLNGEYSLTDNNKGVIWMGIKWYESMKFAQMMIRPTERCMMRL